MGLKKLIFNRYLHVLYLICYGGGGAFSFLCFVPLLNECEFT